MKQVESIKSVIFGEKYDYDPQYYRLLKESIVSHLMQNYILIKTQVSCKIKPAVKRRQRSRQFCKQQPSKTNLGMENMDCHLP